MDKTNAAEEMKSINSMFEWYQNARVCLTYLEDVDSSALDKQKFESQTQRCQKSEWFKRGWTL